MSIQVSSGSGLSGLPLSLVSTEASVNCSELGLCLMYSKSLSDVLSGSTCVSVWRSLFCRVRDERLDLLARLPRRTWGASSLQGPKACTTTSDWERQACVRRWQADRYVRPSLPHTEGPSTGGHSPVPHSHAASPLRTTQCAPK